MRVGFLSMNTNQDRSPSVPLISSTITTPDGLRGKITGKKSGILPGVLTVFLTSLFGGFDGFLTQAQAWENPGSLPVKYLVDQDHKAMMTGVISEIQRPRPGIRILSLTPSSVKTNEPDGEALFKRPIRVVIDESVRIPGHENSALVVMRARRNPLFSRLTRGEMIEIIAEPIQPLSSFSAIDRIREVAGGASDRGRNRPFWFNAISVSPGKNNRLNALPAPAGTFRSDTTSIHPQLIR